MRVAVMRLTGQGSEHGPRDFPPNPDAADALFQLGLAKSYLYALAGRVPLVLAPQPDGQA